MASVSAFQAEDTGSIPVTCSRYCTDAQYNRYVCLGSLGLFFTVCLYLKNNLCNTDT